MDLRGFYQKIREVEATIGSEHVVLVSLATPDGGKPGVLTEVTRAAGARMITEQRARLAEPEEAARYRQEAEESAKRAEQILRASRMQITVVSEPEMRQLRERLHPKKG